jgi:hypothetical protein
VLNLIVLKFLYHSTEPNVIEDNPNLENFQYITQYYFLYAELVEEKKIRHVNYALIFHIL